MGGDDQVGVGSDDQVVCVFGDDQVVCVFVVMIRWYG